MATQHSAIVDAQRHEVKGADAASSGQVLKSNGDTTTSFVNPSTLSNIIRTDVLENSDTTTQTPSGTDTALQVTFGSATSNTDISLSSGGTVTFNTSGTYEIDIVLNCARAASSGVTDFLARVLVNDVGVSPTYMVSITDDVAVVPLTISFVDTFSATNTLKVEVIQDSTGIAYGHLATFDPVASGWANVPSAYIRIKKVAGAA